MWKLLFQFSSHLCELSWIIKKKKKAGYKVFPELFFFKENLVVFKQQKSADNDTGLFLFTFVLVWNINKPLSFSLGLASPNPLQVV